MQTKNMGLWGIEPSAFQQILIMSDRTVLKRDKYSKMEACDSIFREAWDLQKNMVKNEECVLEKENLASYVKPKERETVELSWALWNVRLHVYIIVHVPTVPLSWWQKMMLTSILMLFVPEPGDRFMSCSVVVPPAQTWMISALTFPLCAW